MEKETLKRIFYFLEKKGEHIIPLPVKIKLAMPITKEDLNVKGDLSFTHTNITSLPEGLIVRGNLYLTYSNITSLPEGLIVRGNLYLSYSNITSLPKGLKVGGYLILGFTKVSSLPEGLKVGGNLYIDNTPLKKYTNKELREMIKPGFIKGKIYRRYL